ncbi:hypothetical protein I4U23_011322 [Adineta vaga]|nr:hypothetical protein I4U23_011322 [Adineta vaga]
MESADDNQTDKKAQKRNHRGTRRQQRYRAKQKLLQLCELASAQAAELMEVQEVVAIVEEEAEKPMNNSLQIDFSLDEQNNEMERQTRRRRRGRSNKRRIESIMTPTIMTENDVIQSFSQLSIIPHAAENVAVKRRRIAAKHRSSKKHHFVPKQQSDVYLLDYLNVPDRIFKKMFISASKSLHASVPYNMICRWLDNSSNMRHIREHARLLDKLLYLQLQQAIWTEYFNIGSLSDGVWASEII